MKSNLKHDSKLDLLSVEANFMKINRERIDVTRQGMGKRQAKFIELSYHSFFMRTTLSYPVI